jgi:hypothetical protein
MIRSIVNRVILAAFLALVGHGAAALPTSVTVFGSLQSEAGCPGDFQASCSNTALAYDATDDVWQRTLNLPSGDYQYLAAIDQDLNQLYGENASIGGLNPVDLHLSASTSVKFYYDDKTHWITDNVGSIIVVLAGSFQSELGCPGDFDPGCLRSWLEDPDGNGIYSLMTNVLPPGNYSTIVTYNESFDERYGSGGIQNGSNIDFTVPTTGTLMTFNYDPRTHILTILPGGDNTAPEPGTFATLCIGLAILGFVQRRKYH